MRKLERVRLTRDDWAAAALEAVARGGIDAIVVESIAAELGATKGSFYWHFPNRDALVEAALERWERYSTDAVIVYLENEPDPARRLRIVMEGGFERGPADRAEIALMANPGHPAALAAVRRVTERRIAYLADQLRALGWSTQEARDRAVLLAYLYVGHVQLAHSAPEITGGAAQRRRVALAYQAIVERD